MARLTPTLKFITPMAILDAPKYPAVTSTSGAERIVAVSGGKEIGLPLHGIIGLLPDDVDSSVENAHTIATRLSVAVGTTPTITMPAAAGDLREVILVNSASGNCTLDTPGSEKIFTATADADTLVIATGKTAILISDGTRWYHVSNDA